MEKSELLIILILLMGVLMAPIFYIAIRNYKKTKSPAQVDLPNQVDAAEKSGNITVVENTNVRLEEALKIHHQTKVTPSQADAVTANLDTAMKETRKSLWGRLKNVFEGSDGIDENFDQLEEILYTSDIGPVTVEKLLGSVKENLSKSDKKDFTVLKKYLSEEILDIFNESQIPEPATTNPAQFLKVSEASPTVWLIVGINGAGKTTTLGKISALLAGQGKKVLVAAGDTFRAAASEQLKAWTIRADGQSVNQGQVEIFEALQTKDPAALAFEAIQKAKNENYDYVLIDTAGRLHTQSHLMEELKKVKRVMQKHSPEFPHETLIVLDGNNGQNALQQAQEFHKSLGLSGVIVTKMDGTAKGGVVIGLVDQLSIPIRMIGIGEKIQDLKAFSAKEFTHSILDL